MKNLNVLMALLLILLMGCGLKVGNLDVGKLASSGKQIISGGELSPAQQSKVGEEMAAILLGTAPLVTETSLNRYINRVGRWLTVQLPEDSRQWHFGIILTDDFNAFSTPSGHVLISTGVISRLRSEAELAAVLAHEIAHVYLQHQVEAIEKSRTYQGVGELLFTVADSQQQAKGGYDKNSYRNRQIAEGVFNVTRELYTLGLSRDDENAADRFAVRLLTRAGYDSYAYISMLQVLQSVSPDKQTLWLTTHPPTDERLVQVAPVAEQLFSQYGSGKNLSDRYQKQVSKR